MKAHLQTQETKTEAEAIQHPEDMYEVFASAEQVTRRISELRDHMLNKGATNVDLITLVDKEVERTAYEAPLISGFHAPNKWLVGMGMDNKAVAPEAGRGLN